MESNNNEEGNNYNWQDVVLIVGIILITTYYAIMFASFNQLPSEYYGGDHYAHLGSAWKIFTTNNPFISSHYIGELSHYPWLTPLTIAMFAKITFQNPFTAAIFLPLLLQISSMIITYIVGKRFFKNKSAALLLTITWAVVLIPTIHPSEVAKQLFIPLIFLMILLIYKDNPTTNEKVAAGVIFALASLQHLVTFIVAALSIILIFILQVIEKKKIKLLIKNYLPVIIIGIMVASLFWLPIYIKYGGETLNDWQAYATESLYPSTEFISGAIQTIIGINHPSLPTIIALPCILFFFLITIKRADKRLFIPLVPAIAALIGIIHPYITFPLFDMTAGYYRFPIVFLFVGHFLFVAGIFTAYKEIIHLTNNNNGDNSKYNNRSKKSNNKTKKIINVLAIIFIFLLTTFMFTSTIQNFKESDRYRYATDQTVTQEAYKEFMQFLKTTDQIHPNSVVATLHPDVAFLFNGMTGSNVLLTRVTHANPFVYHNKRAADLAVIMYGDDDTKRKELIKKYGLTHFFIESANEGFETLCNYHWEEIERAKQADKTLLVYWCLQTSPEYKDYLEEYGVETAMASVRLAAGDKDVPLTEVLAIKPTTLEVQGIELFSYKNAEGDEVMKLYEIA